MAIIDGLKNIFKNPNVSTNSVAKNDKKNKANDSSIMDRLNTQTQEPQEREFSGSLSLNELDNIEDNTPKISIDEVMLSKKSASSAKYAFNKEPSGTKIERELQKKYIEKENDYAQKVLDCPDSTEKDVYEALHELRVIVDFAKHPLVQDRVVVTKDLRDKLNQKLDKFNNPKWEKLAKDNNIEIDTDLAKQIAESSQESAGYQKTSTALCAMRVRQALEKSGAVEPNETKVSSAYMLNDKYLKTGSFAKVEVNTLEELRDLPPGCIIVWERGQGFGKAFAQHGHVAVTQGLGKATSDYNQEIKNYKSKFSVYVPKKVSASERVQNAKISTEDYSKQTHVRDTANSNISHKQYLFDYVKAANSIIAEGNVPKSEVEDLIALMKQVPKKSINLQEQKVLNEIHSLTQKLEILIGT